MTTEEETRTLDSLGSALSRATGLLGSIGDLYEADEDRFHGGSAFAAHGVTTAHHLLVEASAKLGEVYAAIAQRQDLEAAWHVERSELLQELETARAKATTLADTDYSEVEVETEVEAVLPWQGADGGHLTEEMQSSEQIDEFAQSYHELLQRVTAVEVFATKGDVAAVEGTSPDLLNLVQDLKAELLRLKRVA